MPEPTANSTPTGPSFNKGPARNALTKGQVKPVVENALARATILLNLGDRAAAGAQVQSALDADPNFKIFAPYAGFGPYAVTGHEFMPAGLAFWSPRHALVVVTKATWSAQVVSPAIHRFAKGFASLREPAWVAYDDEDFDIVNSVIPGLREMLGDDA